MARPSLENSDLFLNPEISWLAFNRRVLEEAEDARNPLLERVKFLAITASNLDEFFEVRIAGLLQRMEDGRVEPGPDGLTPQQELDVLARQVHEFVEAQYQCWNVQLLPILADNGIFVRTLAELTPDQQSFIEDYCDRELDPLLTPVTVDPAHPFPRVINKALCLALLLRRRRRASASFLGVVTVPRALPRLVRLPATDGGVEFIALADLVMHHASSMYSGYDILSSAAFRVTRNSNLYIEEEEARSLMESVRTELHNRRRGDAVRLEIESGAEAEMTERLRSMFELENWQVFHTDGPVNLSRLMSLATQTDRPDLKFKPFTPRPLQLTAKSGDLFEELRAHDIMLHHPYDSYDSVVKFIEAAAEDPAVLAIKQTLYRTSPESPIMHALIEAASHKEVTVVVELTARFDEASNIRWARYLEDAGVQVFHGLVGLKTHAKLALLVRRDADGATRRYVHLGTGNYNSVTAKLYTDLSLLTADPDLTSSVHDIFNFLTAYSEKPGYDPLMLAPLDMAQKVINLIDREAEHARRKQPARIIAKMNALTDKQVIQALYRASQAGVQVDLIVRGMCALVPGVRGVSDRIRVRSIVGRFLEHSRIFYFENGGDTEAWLGSADWMPRNLYDRVETLFPIRDSILCRRVADEILAAYLADTEKARVLLPDSTYVRASDMARTKPVKLFNAQQFLIDVAEGRCSAADIPGYSKRPRTRRRKTVRA